MIYECIANINDQQFVMARPRPAKWSSSELQYPFEIVESSDMLQSDLDYTEFLQYSFGELIIKASEIDVGLVTSNG